MVDLILTISNKLKKMMEEFPEINWSEVIKDSIKKRLAELNLLKGFRIDSELSPNDALKLGREVNKLLFKHYKSE